MSLKQSRWAKEILAVIVATAGALSVSASPALASTRTCTFNDFVGSYYTWYANCDGNLALAQADGRYIRQFSTHDGVNYYSLTQNPTTTAVANPGEGEMRAYVGGFVLSYSGDGASCSNIGGNVYYCTWG